MCLLKTGDNKAAWEDLRASSVTVMNMNLFGIPMIGSDMCGFLDDTTEELCARWMALGAFHPFSRNHNTIGVAPQEPYLWESVAGVSRTALGLRYRLLPYLYTLFYKANAAGSLVAQPLWAVFNHDAATHSIDEQFLWGDSVLVSPALYEGQETVTALFPTRQGETATWYSLSDTSAASVVSCPEAGESVSVDMATPWSAVNVHVKSGAVLALHAAADPTTGEAPLTTVAARALPYELLVTLDANAANAAKKGRGGAGDDAVVATGSVFLDDGVQATLEKATLMEYSATASSLSATVSDATGDGYKGAALSTVATVSVLGVATEPSAATIDASDAALPFTYDADKQLLTIDLSETKVAMNTEFTLSWK